MEEKYRQKRATWKNSQKNTHLNCWLVIEQLIEDMPSDVQLWVHQLIKWLIIIILQQLENKGKDVSSAIRWDTWL